MLIKSVHRIEIVDRRRRNKQSVEGPSGIRIQKPVPRESKTNKKELAVSTSESNFIANFEVSEWEVDGARSLSGTGRILFADFR